MVQDEVTWVLEAVKSNWPDGPLPDHFARINRDEPLVLETGERKKGRELDRWNAIAASLADRTPTPVGDEYDHRVETVVSLRFEGLTSQSGEHGHIDSSAHFEQLVRYIQHAIATQRSYPTVGDVDNDGIGSVAYHSLFIENETDLSADNRDYFRRDFDVRLVGYSSLP